MTVSRPPARIGFVLVAVLILLILPSRVGRTQVLVDPTPGLSEIKKLEPAVSVIDRSLLFGNADVGLLPDARLSSARKLLKDSTVRLLGGSVVAIPAKVESSERLELTSAGITFLDGFVPLGSGDDPVVLARVSILSSFPVANATDDSTQAKADLRSALTKDGGVINLQASRFLLGGSLGPWSLFVKVVGGVSLLGLAEADSGESKSILAGSPYFGGQAALNIPIINADESDAAATFQLKAVADIQQRTLPSRLAARLDTERSLVSGTLRGYALVKDTFGIAVTWRWAEIGLTDDLRWSVEAVALR